MDPYSLAHLSDGTLLRALSSLVAERRAHTARLLAHLAEVDARRLYLPAAHPSMFSYCVQELGFSEQSAYKHIRSARAARRFPALFAAVADGRLHVSAVVLLAPYLTPENAAELLAAAAHQRSSAIEQLLAERFPRPDLPEQVTALPSPPPEGQLSLRTVESPGPRQPQLSPGPVAPPAPGRPEPAPRERIIPLARNRFGLQFTVGQNTHDNLRHAQALLGHQLPSVQIAAVFDRALDALIAQLERRKIAGTDRPRPGAQRPSPNPRHIPADVKRAVWQRDGGQCTFVSQSGQRCPARTRLEFDHRDPVARGGRASVAGIRLVCRAHNQHAAECTFGPGFMADKRREAQQGRAHRSAPGRDPEKDVTPWLRQLGISAAEARRVASACESIPDASLEERVRFALRLLTPPHRRPQPPMKLLPGR
jgi:hypothetical protein